MTKLDIPILLTTLGLTFLGVVFYEPILDFIGGYSMLVANSIDWFF